MRTITTPQAAHILGMTFRTLDNWVRTGLVTSSQVAHGRGTRRAWTVDDVARVAFLQTLRQNGVSTHRLNVMKKPFHHLLDHLLEQETAGDERALADFVFVFEDRIFQITIRPKRRAIEQAFAALAAGLLPQPLTYDDAPSGIDYQVTRDGSQQARPRMDKEE